ncbi:MAG: S26 family signal peptidase [Bacteroidales bacterium]
MKKFTTRQWIKFSLATLLYVPFCIWVQNLWLLLGIALIAEIYLFKFIPWGFWKKSKNPLFRMVMEWVDEIVFALIAVSIIFTFFFQNYQIPSSSLEKTLLVGDFLMVSKLNYGPRIPNTPIAFPLAQHTMPVLNTKSYLDWPNWPYKRLKGLGSVKRNDIVVFNFPAGDTVALQVTNPDYYTLCYLYGRDQVVGNKEVYGDIIYRPVDRRENYVKRCVALPGDMLEVRNNDVYINGDRQTPPKKMQLNYFVQTNGQQLNEEHFRHMEVSVEDRVLLSNHQNFSAWALHMGFEPNADGTYPPLYHFPLTQEAVEWLNNSGLARKIIVEPDPNSDTIYPLGYYKKWTRDNYGPVWIPKKGMSIELTPESYPIYERCIVNYEGNKAEERDGKYFINGKEASTYTFQMDYYFMMGDNRHNSADSRMWGFVPEDHIVGEPVVVWLSLDKDRSLFDGKIRFNRLFNWVIQN